MFQGGHFEVHGKQEDMRTLHISLTGNISVWYKGDTRASCEHRSGSRIHQSLSTQVAAEIFYGRRCRVVAVQETIQPKLITVKTNLEDER